MTNTNWFNLDLLLFAFCVTQIATAANVQECSLFAFMALGFGLLALKEWSLIK